MEITIAQVAAAVGTATGIVGLITLATRHGRMLQRLDAVEERLRACGTAKDLEAIRAALEECVSAARWVDHTQHFSEKLRAMEAAVERLADRLREAEMRVAHSPTWPPDRPTG